MARYKYTTLTYIEKYLPEMKDKKVSVKARSKDQFIDQFRKAKGNPKNLPEKWQKKRDGFVARTKRAMEIHQQKGHNVKRQRLSLIAWGYNPK